MAASYSQAVVTAAYNPPGTNDPGVVSSVTCRVFVAETPEAFTYDDDADLLSVGRFVYVWDAENRLVCATTRDDLPADVPRIRLTHSYDYQWRRLATERESWTGSALQATIVAWKTLKPEDWPQVANAIDFANAGYDGFLDSGSVPADDRYKNYKPCEHKYCTSGLDPLWPGSGGRSR